MIFSFSDSINTRVDTELIRRPPKFPSNNKGGITKQSKRKLIEKLTGIHGFSKKRGMAINSSLFIQILLHVWTLLTYGKKIWISSLCVSVNIINFALNFDCSQQGICVKIRLYRITSIMIQNPAKNKKKNSDSHKPQRQYVPEHEQKDPEQLNVGIQWKLRVVRLHSGSFFWTTMTWNLSTSIWRFHTPQYYSKIRKTRAQRISGRYRVIESP